MPFLLCVILYIFHFVFSTFILGGNPWEADSLFTLPGIHLGCLCYEVGFVVYFELCFNNFKLIHFQKWLVSKNNGFVYYQFE